MGQNIDQFLIIVSLFSTTILCASEDGFVISFTENDIVSNKQWAIFTGNLFLKISCIRLIKGVKKTQLFFLCIL